MTAPHPGQPIRCGSLSDYREHDDGDTQMEGAMGTEFCEPAPKLGGNRAKALRHGTGLSGGS